MIMINFHGSEHPKGVPVSACIGNRPIARIYTGSKYACVYSNFLLENLAVHMYNKYHYSNKLIKENSSSSSGGANGKFRYSTPATSSSYSEVKTNTTNFKNRCINRYDSFLYTANATSDTNYWNPNYGVKDESGNLINRYGGIDLSSDGGYERSIDELIYIHGHSTGIAEWPHPVLLNTKNGTTIELSEDSNYNNKIIKLVAGRITFVYNLIPSRHYYYRVLNNNTVVREGQFNTEGKIRMIKLDNVLNTRDLGGYLSVDGTKLFKYGKVIRGAQLELQLYGSGSNKYIVTLGSYTESDGYELRNNLNIDKEIDIRGLSGTPNINDHLYIDYNLNDTLELEISRGLISPGRGDELPDYYGITSSPSPNTSGRTGFEIFMVFLKATLKSNNGVFIHCLEGRDRTGTACAILLGICDVHGDGILKDYELTTFWGNGSKRYELLYWDCKDSGWDTGDSVWGKHHLLESMISQCSSTATTIPGVILDWFKYRYNLLGASSEFLLTDDNNNTISDGQSAIEYVLSKLMEPIYNITLNSYGIQINNAPASQNGTNLIIS